MPSISLCRLHKRDFLARTIAASGQFAHRTRNEIDALLGLPYDRGLRLQRLAEVATDDSDDWHDIEAAVPDAVYKMHRAGQIPQLYDVRAVNFVSRRIGVLCCLCLKIELPCWSWQRLPSHLLQFICPTRLRVDLPDPFPASSKRWRSFFDPVCGECEASMFRHICGRDADKEPKSSPLWGETLAWFLGNDRFRKRIRDNARNASRLRFDPRRPQLQSVAA